MATKLDTLKSKPQDSELPFVSASELRRFPKKLLPLDNVLTSMINDFRRGFLVGSKEWASS